MAMPVTRSLIRARPESHTCMRFITSAKAGSGWRRFHLDTDRGIETVWGEAPRGADRARFKFARETREEEVVHGVYIAVWWDVSCPEIHAEPTEFRVNGKWVQAPTRAELFGAQREAWRRAREAGGAA